MTPDVPILNGGSISMGMLDPVPMSVFRDTVVNGVRAGARIASLFGSASGAVVRLYAILAWKDRGELSVITTVPGDRYPSLTPECPQAQLFEREIAEQWNIVPVGHPWLKPVRYEKSRHDSGAPALKQEQKPSCGIADYFRIEGDEIHEVAVGPVHAGIIEPGHFRFQCHGETVHHLEISLGYQHRGIERALSWGDGKKRLHYMETLAGDTSIGHALAHCRAVESLAKCRVSARAQVIRGIALELERIANHIGDLGALAGDIGFLPTLSYCGRIRGDVLNLTASLCGNRFGRGLLRPGGVCWDLDEKLADSIRVRFEAAYRDAESAVGLLWETPSVQARFEKTGAIHSETAREIGLVGVAARACGLEQDVRQDFPYGIYRMSHIPVSTWHSGDVFARAIVRWQEIQRSAKFIIDQLKALPDGPTMSALGDLARNHLAVALAEGWRGEICHVVITDAGGRPVQYKVVDPSFHNWFGLAYALRNQQISDFPLCNKSFNLSYCGHDL